MADGDDNIATLPIRFKKPPEDDAPQLKVVSGGDCDHRYFFAANGEGISGRFHHVTYHIREGETEVECGNCKTRLDPMWVLRELANRESRWNQTRLTYQEEMARLRERERTKCDHCGKMTRISRR
jgi:hypothetical protein